MKIRNVPYFIAAQILFRLSIRCSQWFVVRRLCELALLHWIGLRWCGLLRYRLGSCGDVACIEGCSKVLGKESVVKEVAEIGIHNAFLRISVVTKEDRIELSTVLLC